MSNVFAIGMWVATCSTVIACDEETTPATELDILTERAELLRGHSPPAGLWRTQVPYAGTYVDLIWVIGEHYAWHVVIAYADEERTVPLLRWDLLRKYEFEAKPRRREGRFDIVWHNLDARLYAYENEPELFAGIQVDDCDLEVGVSRDLTEDDCGAPLFPFATCPLFDFVRIEDDILTFGDPTEGNRCEQRPTGDEAWSFHAEALSNEVLETLFDVKWRR